MHQALAQSPVEVAIADLDDVLVVDERPNMPGTVDEWPNWSIALPSPRRRSSPQPAPAPLRPLTDR